MSGGDGGGGAKVGQQRDTSLEENDVDNSRSCRQCLAITGGKSLHQVMVATARMGTPAGGRLRMGYTC